MSVPAVTVKKKDGRGTHHLRRAEAGHVVDLLLLNGAIEIVGAEQQRLLRNIQPGRDTDFFFSSRRRHTRLVSDGSSDVCSSDLIGGKLAPPAGGLFAPNKEKAAASVPPMRSEERRVGKECRYRWSTYYSKKK